MEPARPQIDLTVAALLADWPATMTVFFQRQMAWVGCVLARFETIREAADSYAIPAPLLLAEICAAIGIADASESS